MMIEKYQKLIRPPKIPLFHRIFLMLLLVMIPAAGFGQNLSERELNDLLQSKIRSIRIFALHPTIIQAVKDQNAENLSLETIQERDAEWTQSDDSSPLKRSMQQSPAGRYLRDRVEQNPAFNEAFATDNQGANVAAYPLTSDYWQGDEEKWTASFNDGNGQVFIGPLERDESTNTVAVQVSAPIFDQRETIGVLVVGVTLSYLETKQTQ